MSRDYSHLLPEIESMLGYYSGPAMARVLGVPVQHIRNACRDAEISLPRSAPKDGQDGGEVISIDDGRYTAAGFTSKKITNVRRAGEVVETHGPVRVLMQGGVRCNFEVAA